MWLEVVSGEDAGRVVRVSGTPEAPFVLGRVHGSDLVIRDSRASRRHAALAPTADGGLRLEDLGSANGTWVDGARVSEAVLHGGETLEIASVRLAVHAEGPGALRRPRLSRGSHAAVAAAGLAGGALVVLAVGSLFAGEDESAPRVVRAVATATVLVQALRDGAPSATGSGWIADPTFVVTAAHVVNEGASFVVGRGAQVRRASVFAAAPCEDLAVLQVPRLESENRLHLGDDADVEQGETVLALGYPAGSHPGDGASSTRGVVSAVMAAFRDPAPDIPFYAEAVRTDTALDPGFSGGPLVDLDRNVVGVNAAARTTGDDGRLLQGANYAIGPGRARRVLADLRAGRSRAWIGADFGYPTPEELAARGLPEGLYLLGAVAGSPAALAGLGGHGELLIAVNGHRVGRTLAGWCAATRGIASGEPAELTVMDADGATRKVRVRFG
jgi:S1-C subfamily serine protease